MKTWKGWTVHELDGLERMRLDGLTVEQIAVELGRTVPSVKCRLASEGICRPRSMRWLQVLNCQHSIAGVAKVMGVTKWAVKQAKRKLRRAGFDIPDAVRQGVMVEGDSL